LVEAALWSNAFNRLGTWFIQVSNKYGNVASVIGLLIAISGIFLTLYRIGKINKEIQAVEENAKSLIGLIGLQLFSFEVSSASRSIELIINSCKSKDWPRAEHHCDHAQLSIVRLSEHPHIDEELSEYVGQYANDLSLSVPISRQGQNWKRT